MRGASITLLFVFLLYVTTLLILRFTTGRNEIARQPVTWFYSSWFFGLILLSLPLFTYYETIEIKSLTYIIYIMGAFSIGSIFSSLIAKTWKNKIAAHQQNDSDRVIKITRILLIAGIIGTLALIANAILSGGLSLSERLNPENSAAIRADHMSQAPVKIGPLYGPANLSSSLGGLGLIFSFYLIGKRQTKPSSHIKLLASILLFLDCFGAMYAFGSRMFAIFAMMMGGFAFMQGRWANGEVIVDLKPTASNILKIIFTIIGVMSIIWFSSTFFLENRVGKQDASSLLFRTHRAHFSQEAYEVIRSDRSLQYFLFSASYASTPIATLTYYLDLPESRLPGPFYGEYNFPPIGRWVRRLTFNWDDASWDRARYFIFKPLEDLNFGGNVWSTFPRDLIADFGISGSIIFIFAMGFVSQSLHEKQHANPNHIRAAVMVYFKVIFLFCGYVSILYLPFIHWPLYAASIMLMLPKRTIKNKSSLIKSC